MGKLLSANFLRLRKSKVFWILTALMAAYGLYAPIGSYLDQQRYLSWGVTEYTFSLDGIFFNYVVAAGLLTAVFISLFFGTEYSDGAIRNKLAVGHPRWSVYLANLVTGVAAVWAFCAAYMLPTFLLGVILLGFFTQPLSFILLVLLGTLLLAAAFCAITTFIAMNCTRKAATVVGCIFIVLTLMLAGSYINERLSEPREYSSYELTSGDGETLEKHMVPNPGYLEGTKRAAYEFLFDFLPGGQMIQYSGVKPTGPVRLPLYSLCVFVGISAAGMAIFKKKDLK